MKRTSVFSTIYSGSHWDSFAIRRAAVVVLVLVAVLVVPAVGLPAGFGATGGLGQAAATNAAQPNSAQSYSIVSHVAAPTSTASNTAAPNGAAAAAPSTQYSVQGTVASAQGAPVSYASVTQVNGLLDAAGDDVESGAGRSDESSHRALENRCGDEETSAGQCGFDSAQPAERVAGNC